MDHEGSNSTASTDNGVGSEVATKSMDADTLDPTKGEGLYLCVIAAFEKAKADGGKIYTKQAAEAARTVLPVYETVFGQGIVSNNLKKDLQNSSSKVIDAYETYPDERCYVGDLVQHEVTLRGVEELRKDRVCGVKNLLWMKRALDFILSFLEKCVSTDDSVTAKQCALDVYNEVLKPYHGWLISNVVTMAFNLCPTKQKLLEKLGFPELQEARKKVKSLLVCTRPIITEIHRVLEEANCNFPDKV